jgi:NAD(P)-dependent dehydrogenase (short-subunit alcohol dehydrogenase family)
MLNDPLSMDGKTVLITGASSGVGLASALLLAERGAFVVMICRNPVRARFMRNEIAKWASGRSPALFLADLSSQGEIHRLADDLYGSISRIDVLINSAGTVFTNRELTVDGVEKTLAVNHIAPFLVTSLLLDLVRAAPAGRILTLASGVHSSSLDFSNLHGERHYDFIGAYRRSKLCNILFTYELARRLAGTAITANCLSPGPTLTRLGDNLTGLQAIFPWVVKRIPFVLGLPEGGGRPIVYAATSPALAGITGRFFLRGRDTRTKPITYNGEVAEKLWNATGALCEGRGGQWDISHPLSRLFSYHNLRGPVIW